MAWMIPQSFKPYDGGNTTGFASPAEDWVESPIDLAEIIGLRRPSRYPVRVSGDSLRDRGVLDGDILIVDTDAPYKSGCLVIAMVHGQSLVACLTRDAGVWWLKPSEGGSRALRISETVEVWGVATGLVRQSV